MYQGYIFFLHVVSFVSIFVGIVLLTYSAKTPSYNRILAAYFILISYPCILTILLGNGMLFSVPHLYRTGVIALFIALPMPYLYMKMVLEQKRIGKWDILHLVPVLVYIVDFLPFFLLPGDQKMTALKSGDLTQMGRSVVLFKESQFFPAGFYTIFRYFLSIIYWAVQVLLLLRVVNLRDIQFKENNRSYIRWLVLFTLLQSATFLPPLTLLKGNYATYQWILYGVMLGGVSGITGLFLFFFPEILYGIKNGVIVPIPKMSDVFYSERLNPDHEERLPDSLNREPEASQSDVSITFVVDKHAKEEGERKNRYQYLSEGKMKEIKNRIDHHFTENKPFLKLQYSQTQLSQELKIPIQYISATINEYEKAGFADFINSQRVYFAIDLLRKDSYKHLKLESFAKECGFNNRNTFTTSFKKYTGKTPSDFIRDLN